MTGSAKLYKDMLREQVGPLLRASGFKGSGGRWVLSDAGTGDMAIVQAQSSAWNSASTVSFYVNLAVVPVPWWTYLTDRDGDNASKTPKEYHGVWRDRLDGRAGGSWTITDAASAQRAGQHIATLLTTEGVPQLRQFLNRSALLGHLRAMEHNPIFRSEPLAVLLADAGPNAELDEILDQIRADVDDGNYPPVRARSARRLIDWARQHAARQR